MSEPRVCGAQRTKDRGLCQRTVGVGADRCAVHGGPSLAEVKRRLRAERELAAKAAVKKPIVVKKPRSVAPPSSVVVSRQSKVAAAKAADQVTRGRALFRARIAANLERREREVIDAAKARERAVVVSG